LPKLKAAPGNHRKGSKDIGTKLPTVFNGYWLESRKYGKSTLCKTDPISKVPYYTSYKYIDYDYEYEYRVLHLWPWETGRLSEP